MFSLTYVPRGKISVSANGHFDELVPAIGLGHMLHLTDQVKVLKARKLAKELSAKLLSQR